MMAAGPHDGGRGCWEEVVVPQLKNRPADRFTVA
jgi:hypothetical protein